MITLGEFVKKVYRVGETHGLTTQQIDMVEINWIDFGERAADYDLLIRFERIPVKSEDIKYRVTIS